MKIVFCGTPEFAVPSLAALYEAGHELMVITQPDRPKNRGHKLLPTPVKVFAMEHGLTLYQFEKIRSREALDVLSAFEPDLLITCAYGQILSQKNLDIPRLCCINIHGSILPKWRGASPVQSAVIAGDAISGVTIMRMALKLDSGDIISAKSTQILPDETYGELLDRLSYLGAELLLETLPKLSSNTAEFIPQNHDKATFAPLITKDMARIDFDRSALSIHNLVRGMNPMPGAWTMLNDSVVRIWKTRLLEDITPPDVPPGTCFIANSRQGLYVMCKDGAIEVVELQLTGGKRMEARALLNGKKLLGSVFE
ncbi:MAG: methionyl-tRNA formyltransferase [Clostridia bacterium]|nr:methionyl-tRNA formyltransferase [Clostridia bacterium]